eukprot:3126399-Rhodomonas_salina.1
MDCCAGTPWEEVKNLAAEWSPMHQNQRYCLLGSPACHAQISSRSPNLGAGMGGNADARGPERQQEEQARLRYPGNRPSSFERSRVGQVSVWEGEEQEHCGCKQGGSVFGWGGLLTTPPPLSGDADG